MMFFKIDILFAQGYYNSTIDIYDQYEPVLGKQALIDWQLASSPLYQTAIKVVIPCFTGVLETVEVLNQLVCANEAVGEFR